MSILIDHVSGNVSASSGSLSINGTVPQPIHSILTSLSGLSTSSTGLLKLTNGVASFDTSDYLVSGGALGTPSSGTLTNCTGYTYANLTGTVPTWNQNTTGTAAGLSATLAVSSGGTGAATLAANNVLLGNGTSAVQTVAPGTSGNVLVSNGTTWVSGSAATASLPTQTGNSGKYLTTDGTNASWGASTGTGNVVLSTNAVLTTPNLGTPSALTLTNATGLPVATGISGLATGVATFLATPSSANLISAVTDETGTGALVFATSPTLVTPNLGTPSTVTLTNATGLPISTGVSGLATGVATFLAAPTSANLISAVTDETGTGSLVFGTGPTIDTPKITTELRINNTGNTNYVGFKAGTISANKVWTLPTADGTANQALKTDGAGNLGWTSDVTTPAGANTQIQFNNSGALGASSSLTWDGTNLSSPILVSTNSVGAEGGEVRLALAATGNSLSTSVTIDIFQNKLRFFETGGTNRGAYIDLSAAVTGVGSNLLSASALTYGTGVTTWFATPSSANLAAAMTDETGTGALVFATSPTLVTPVLGTPTSGDLSNCTNAIGYSLKSASTTINLSSATAPTTGQVLTATSGTAATWQTISALPSQTGNSGKYLTTDGTTASWGAISGATKTISNITAAYTVVAGDLGKIINCTSNTFTVSLTAAATLGSGFNCTIWNTSNNNLHTITIDPNASETLDNKLTLILQRGEGVDIVCDGANWQTSYKKAMRNYAENTNYGDGRASATNDGSLAIGGSSVSSGAYAYVFGYNAQATASGALALGIGYSTAIVAGSNYSTAIGSNSTPQGSITATGAGAMALGGSYSSGTDSFAAAIANNTNTYGAQGANSIAMGPSSKAASNWGIAIGNACVSTYYTSIAMGYTATCSGLSGIAIGQGANATGNGAIALGGAGTAISANATANGAGSVAITGGLANETGKYAFSATKFSNQGDAQFGTIVLSASTSTNTSVILVSDKYSSTAPPASTNNQLIIANNQAMLFFGTLIAKQSASANMAAYNIKGAIVNNGGTVSISALSLETFIDTIGLTTQPTFTADNTNKALSVTSGNKATTNIRWVCTLQTSEVTYA